MRASLRRGVLVLSAILFLFTLQQLPVQTGTRARLPGCHRLDRRDGAGSDGYDHRSGQRLYPDREVGCFGKLSVHQRAVKSVSPDGGGEEFCVLC